MNKFMYLLSKIEFTSFDGNKFTSNDGLELSYYVKLTDFEELPSAQILARIGMNGVFLDSWGFTSEAEQREFVRYWKSLEYKIRNIERENEERVRKEAIELIKRLTDES